MEYTASEHQSPYGFRLQPSREKDTCGSSGSVASYKQRIDSMFDETQSVATERGNQRNLLRSQSIENGEDTRKLIENDNKLLVKNMVQARIEKMFAEVEGDGESKGLRSRVDSSMFYVDYLGSLPLMMKVSSLEGLQEPLKNLYLNHKQVGNIEPTFQDVLEISNCGLRVKYLDEKQDELVEQLNPFPTIAVWAAVKLVCRPRGLDHGKEFGLEYAFMPLISDPEHIDKMTLFRKLTPNEACYFTGDYYSDHSPLFVAVMRKLGVSRQLECHGFVCDTNESAIVIAANLYKALVITMAKNPTSEDNYRKKNLKQKNGLNTVCSTVGSSFAGDLECFNSVQDDIPPRLPPVNTKKGSGLPSSNNITLNVNPPKKNPPPRPPRKERPWAVRKLNDTVVLHVNHPDPDEILQLPNPPSQSPHFLKSNSFNFTNANKNEALKLAISNPLEDVAERFGNKEAVRSNRYFVGKHGSFSKKDFSDVGDILTKVAIPRSHSFLNANGPLSSRYSRHASSGPFIGNSIKRKTSIGSPLGLNELFNEFRMQEGLNNLEDILSAIIDPDGMSFNDLKPIYKEFLLKLAVTLTKDEMYQRSKSIMQRQKRRRKKATRMNSSKLKISFTAGGGLKRVFRRSLLKLKQKKTKPNGFEFSSVLFPSCTRIRDKNVHKKSSTYLKGYGFPYNSSSDESSLVPQNYTNSCEIQQRAPLKEVNLPDCSKISILPSQAKENKKTISEFREFFSIKANEKNDKPLIQNKVKSQPSENCIHHASSGYFSCSDCSYDSESCTYTSADRCYCLRRNPGQSHMSAEIQEKNNMSLTSCECDTDSCFESEKCYCNQKRKPSLFEQLKQQGFAASESSLSRANSPTTSWQKNEADIKNEIGRTKQNKEDLQTSKSLEFLKVRHRHNSMSQLPIESKYKKSNNIYQSPVDDFESELRRSCFQKSSLSSSSPVTSSSGSKSNKSMSSQLRSLSSDNLALDYNMFSTNGKTEDQLQHSQQKKVLVVSTRDPKGRVIYVSAAQRCNSPIQIFNTKRDNTDALSVKKSAEIAALFSDVKLSNCKASSSISSVKDEVIYNTLEPPDYFFSRQGSNYSKKTSLESSLGYFP